MDRSNAQIEPTKYQEIQKRVIPINTKSAEEYVRFDKNFREFLPKYNSVCSKKLPLKPKLANMDYSIADDLFVGDDTWAGTFKSLGMCFLTLGLGPLFLSVYRYTTSYQPKVDSEILFSKAKAYVISEMGLDDSQETNKLYRLPLNEIRMLGDAIGALESETSYKNTQQQITHGGVQWNVDYHVDLSCYQNVVLIEEDGLKYRIDSRSKIPDVVVMLMNKEQLDAHWEKVKGNNSKFGVRETVSMRAYRQQHENEKLNKSK